MPRDPVVGHRREARQDEYVAQMIGQVQYRPLERHAGVLVRRHGQTRRQFPRVEGDTASTPSHRLAPEGVAGEVAGDAQQERTGMAPAIVGAVPTEADETFLDQIVDVGPGRTQPRPQFALQPGRQRPKRVVQSFIAPTDRGIVVRHCHHTLSRREGRVGRTGSANGVALHMRNAIRTRAERLPFIHHKGFHTPLATGIANGRHGATSNSHVQEGSGVGNFCAEVRYLHVPPRAFAVKAPGRRTVRYVTAPDHLRYTVWQSRMQRGPIPYGSLECGRPQT